MDKDNGGYQGKAYETGGFFPITNQKCWQRAVFWPLTKEGTITLLTQQPGTRAAASRIRISRFQDDQIPSRAEPVKKGSRLFTAWYEEGSNWSIMVGSAHLHSNQAVNLFVGVQRWALMSRYFGVNSLSGMGAAYQGVFWRSKVMEGFEHIPWSSYEQARLTALVCEKYSMKFIPEVFMMQWYLNMITLPELAENPQDVRSMNCNGGERGPGVMSCDLNPLHPVVQQRFIDGLGELADSLRDSPAFGGITARADVWGFRGEFFYPSIHWGYGDWTIRQFEKDAGVVVKAGPSDKDSISKLGEKNPLLYALRFEFLTSKEMRDKWIAWRCGRIEDYHKRLLKRIRGERDDIFFGIAGSFDCDIELYKASDKFEERAVGCGIDLRKRATIDGLSIIPVGRYGSRSPGVSQRGIYDGFFMRDNVRAGMCPPRGFASYFTYMEMDNWPADKLGIPPKDNGKPPYYCSATIAAGRNSLEKYAVVLAEQDTAYLREGGNADSFGDPEIWKAWMREYSAIPLLPFDRAPGKNDPVAVWQKSVSAETARNLGIEPGLYFYAVNRERYPLKARIQIKKADKVKDLAGSDIPVKDGELAIALEEFGLRSFRAPLDATITLSEADASAEARKYLHKRLTFAENVADKCSNDKAYSGLLASAWDAAENGESWRGRAQLDMAPMMQEYINAGQLPPGMLNTTFPDMLKSSGVIGHWILQEPVISAIELAGFVVNKDACKLRDASEVNPLLRGARTLWSPSGVATLTLKIPAEGEYRLAIGQIAEKPGVAVAYIDGKSLPEPMIIRNANNPETAVFPPIALKPGQVEFKLQGTGAIGVYALRLLPVLRPIPGKEWKVAGTFPSLWGSFHGHADELVKQALSTKYPAEDQLNDDAQFTTSEGAKFGWRFAIPGIEDSLSDIGVHMPLRTYSSSGGVNIAVTRIRSDRDRTALLYLAIDWWAQALP